MSAPPRSLMRLVGLLGTRPDPERSGGAGWFMVVVGAANIALSAWALASGPTPGTDPDTRLVALSVGLMLASCGASILLLRHGNEALSRWFSVLQALALFPVVAFTGLSLYGWLGVVGALGWFALMVAVFCFDAVRRRRRDNGGHAG